MEKEGGMTGDEFEVPAGFQSPPPTALDRLLAGVVNEEDIAREITREVYSGLEPFCSIPDGYTHCVLGHGPLDLESLSDAAVRDLLEAPNGAILNPSLVHLKAIILFQMLAEGDPLVCQDGDPLLPTVGAYLYGPPGVGKTHVMAAYGLRVRELLDQRLERVKQLISEFVGTSYKKFLNLQADWSGPPEGEKLRVMDARSFEEKLNPYDEFKRDVEALKYKLARFPHHPTDLLYLGFGELYELYRTERRRDAAIRAIENARIVFIDDVHPHGDRAQLEVVQHLIERRYELDRPGTFITTNLDTRDLGGGDPTLAQRILSRCSETFVHLNFEGCEDWRIKVKARRIKLIERAIDERLTGKEPPPC
jgi:hypothetical protein